MIYGGQEMETGINKIIQLLENEISDDKILLDFLIVLLRKETFEYSAWYKDSYQKMIEKAVTSGWKNAD